MGLQKMLLCFDKSGNYSSDESKEISRLQRELRVTKDPPEILKINILGKGQAM